VVGSVFEEVEAQRWDDRLFPIETRAEVRAYCRPTRSQPKSLRRSTCRSGSPSVGSSSERSSPLRSRYRGPVSSPRVPGGVVHELPGDLRKALIANPNAMDAWNDITPLARNEFICWVEDAKQETTRERRIRRTQEELEEGQRRPCCWPGCKHRERTGR